MKMANYLSSNTQKVIVYGAAKSGKTGAVMQLSKHYNLLWLDGENGAEVALNPELKISQESLSHIEVIRTLDTPNTPYFAETCNALMKFQNIKFCDSHGKTKCIACNKDSLPMTEIDFSKIDDSWIIVADSLTQLSNSVLNMIKIARGADPTAITVEDSKTNFNDFGKQGNWLDNWLSTVQTAPFNIIVISHEQGIEQTDGTEKLTPVGGTRNFSRNVSRYFGHVVRMSLVNKKHVGTSSTTASTTALTGSRTGAKTESIVVAEGESILRAIFNSHTNYIRTVD